MGQDTRIQLIAALLLVVCLGGSVALTPAIAAESGRAQLGYAETIEESDPPEVALGIAMGAFRGLFVNVLWFRAHQLKQEGKFHEAIELSEAITRLQPRFPRVWVFHAWNLAYNISVATETAPERWEWVNAGIRMLRDEGIPRNPNSVLLHKELAWIFIHKIQGITDDANHYYKRQLAREWTFVLGPPPARPQPNDEDVREIFNELAAAGEGATLADALRTAAIQRRITLLQTIENAPDTIGEAAVENPLVGRLADRLRAAGVPLDINLLRLVEMQWALQGGMEALRDEETGRTIGMQLNPSERNPAFERLFLEEPAADRDLQQAWRVLLRVVRKQVLSHDLHMELPRMIRYTRKYGPLDWRHPASHAAYWATRGVEEGLGRINDDDFDLTNTDRLILHSMQELYRWGDVSYDLLNDSYVAMLNLHFVDSYEKTLEELEKRARFFEDPSRPFRLYGVGYENFIRDVIRVYHRMGDIESAERYYRKLRTSDKLVASQQDAIVQDMSLPLDDFVRLDFQERISSPDVAQSEVYGALRDAYLRGLLRGDTDVFQGQLQYAHDVHQHYMQQQNAGTWADPRATRMGGFMPLRFADAAAAVLVQTLAAGIVGPVQAGMIWRNVPTGLQRVAYDQLRAQLQPRIGEMFNEWFPEPPNMDQFRESGAVMGIDELTRRKQLLGTEKQ